ncbi:MAG: hypothetical protein ACRDVM_03780 [Acidimicrobiia bacterium]
MAIVSAASALTRPGPPPFSPLFERETSSGVHIWAGLQPLFLEDPPCGINQQLNVSAWMDASDGTTEGLGTVGVSLAHPELVAQDSRGRLRVLSPVGYGPQGEIEMVGVVVRAGPEVAQVRLQAAGGGVDQMEPVDRWAFLLAPGSQLAGTVEAFATGRAPVGSLEVDEVGTLGCLVEDGPATNAGKGALAA